MPEIKRWNSVRRQKRRRGAERSVDARFQSVKGNPAEVTRTRRQASVVGKGRLRGIRVSTHLHPNNHEFKTNNARRPLRALRPLPLTRPVPLLKEAEALGFGLPQTHPTSHTRSFRCPAADGESMVHKDENASDCSHRRRCSGVSREFVRAPRLKHGAGQKTNARPRTPPETVSSVDSVVRGLGRVTFGLGVWGVKTGACVRVCTD